MVFHEQLYIYLPFFTFCVTGDREFQTAGAVMLNALDVVVVSDVASSRPQPAAEAGERPPQQVADERPSMRQHQTDSQTQPQAMEFTGQRGGDGSRDDRQAVGVSTQVSTTMSAYCIASNVDIHFQTGNYSIIIGNIKLFQFSLHSCNSCFVHFCLFVVVKR